MKTPPPTIKRRPGRQPGTCLSGKVPLTIRLKPEVRAWIAAEAKRNNTHMGDVVASAIAVAKRTRAAFRPN